MSQETEVALAMDWGGTWCRVGVVDRDGAILWQNRVRNFPGADESRLLADGLTLMAQAREWCGAARPVAGLGIAVAGPIDSDTGTLMEPPNLPALDGVSLKSAWEPRLGFPVQVGNDATLAALGEFEYGAGREERTAGRDVNCLVYVTVSTGIGGGIVERGRLLLGARGLAAEVGHMVIDGSPDAPLCQCGRRGCFEALASGTAIARIARDFLSRWEGEKGALGRLEADQITAERVFDAAGRGDYPASKILEGILENLSAGLTNLLHLYNPDLLTLGGGVTFGLESMGLLPDIYNRMQQRAMSRGHQDFRLVASRLGDNSGLLGAASLVWSNRH